MRQTPSKPDPLWLALGVALLLVGPACAQAGPGSRPELPTLAADAPAGSGMMQPCLERLEGKVRCGRYRVYEDREERTGRTIDLAFVVAEALDSQARNADAVTFFFGGPGSPAVSPAAGLIRRRRDLRERRDLLLVDFRGVGHSQALDCDVPYPGGIESRFGALFPLGHVEACRDRLAQRARLDLYTSAHSMDDLEELRGWLGYETGHGVGGACIRQIQARFVEASSVEGLDTSCLEARPATRFVLP